MSQRASVCLPSSFSSETDGRCPGFVSYTSVHSAEAAIEAMNGFQVPFHFLKFSLIRLSDWIEEIEGAAQAGRNGFQDHGNAARYEQLWPQ